MQLIGADASPFVRKARVVVIETGQEDAVDYVTHATTPVNTADAVRAANPVGKIPALIRDDGPAIYDSRVITRYLDARANAGLYPESRLWEVLTLEATADAIMEAAVLIVYEARVRPEDKQFDGWTDAQWGKVQGGLDAINDRWMSHLSGPLNAAQIAVGCALGYLDFRHGNKDWRADHAALAAWFEDFAQRPSMQATQPT